MFLAPSLDTRVPQIPSDSHDKAIVSDVTENQLLQDELYGVNELNGFMRSHPHVRDRWYAFDEASQLWSRRATPLVS